MATCINYIKQELFEWVDFLFMRNLPGKVGRLIRRIYWGNITFHCSFLSLASDYTITNPNNISIGNNVSIMMGCSLYAHNSGNIIIGNRVSVNSNVILSAADNGEIIVGDDTLIGPNVVIRASNHNYVLKDSPIRDQGHTGGKIVIEKDVWIGANVVVLPNVTVGQGAVIGAGCIVNIDIPSFSLAAGVPARIIQENIRR